jgi:hypothetical protein
MKRCAFCGGRLGLISQREGGLRFWQAHKSAYLQRPREQQKAEGRSRRKMWFDFLIRQPAWMAGG